MPRNNHGCRLEFKNLLVSFRHDCVCGAYAVIIAVFLFLQQSGEAFNSTGVDGDFAEAESGTQRGL